MSILLLLGPKMNFLARASTVTPTSENSNLGDEYLYDYDPATRFRFNVAAADDNITADLNELDNGGFETWSQADYPDNWVDESLGTGNLSEETSNIHGGSSALKLDGNGAGNEAYCTRTIEVVSGQGMTFSGWIAGDATGTYPTAIRIRNLHTGYYLTSGGAWQAAQVDFGSESGVPYAQKTASFTVEPYSTSWHHIVKLEIEIRYEASTNAGYADDFALWPHWDFVSIHGHNLGSNIAVTARSSTNNFGGSDVEEFTLSRTLESPHTFWNKKASLITNRYARIKFTGTNLHDPIEISELVIGELRELSFKQCAPYPISYEMPQIEYGGLSKERINLSQFELRHYLLNFGTMRLAEYREFLEVLRESDFGKSPAVLVPDTSRGDVMFGHIRPAMQIERLGAGEVHKGDLVFEEEGFGVGTT